MSNGAPPIQPAPSPPSVPGIPQPVFGSGSATSPATPIDITGSPIIPPPPMADPVGVPDFPPTGTDTAPVDVPRGPLVGPAVSPASVPPSVAGVQQPQFGSGNANVPPGYFPLFTSGSPSPPIVVPNIFRIGAIPPPLPSTPPATNLVVISPVPTIPQLPWAPPNQTPPTNTVRPVVNVVTNLNVGSQLACNAGTWTNATSYARQWLRDGSPIFGANAVSYTMVIADVGLMISCIVTATGPGGAASAESNAVGPVVDPGVGAREDEQPATLPHRPAVHHGGGSGSLPRPKTSSRKKR